MIYLHYIEEDKYNQLLHLILLCLEGATHLFFAILLNMGRFKQIINEYQFPDFLCSHLFISDAARLYSRLTSMFSLFLLWRFPKGKPASFSLILRTVIELYSIWLYSKLTSGLVFWRYSFSRSCESLWAILDSLTALLVFFLRMACSSSCRRVRGGDLSGLGFVWG